MSNSYRVVSVKCNRDESEYKGNDDTYDIATLNFLIRNFLLNQGVSFPMPKGLEDKREIFQHHISGTGYPEAEID